MKRQQLLFTTDEEAAASKRMVLYVFSAQKRIFTKFFYLIMGSVTKEMESYKTYIRRGRTEIHRDQAIVERFNRTLAERLFGHQYAVEMLLPEGQRSTAWVKRLPDIVKALNDEVTSLTSKKPALTIKEKAVASKPSTKYSRPVGMKEKNYQLLSM